MGQRQVGHDVIAAKYLAKKSSSVLTVIGCGEEARSGIKSFLYEFPGLKQIRLFDINADAMRNVHEQFGGQVDVTCCKDAKEAVQGADIVLLVTTALKPVVLFDWLEKGYFVCGLYSFNDLHPERSRKANKWYL